MTIKFIVPFLCFYATIIVGGKDTGILKKPKHPSDPPLFIDTNPIYQKDDILSEKIPSASPSEKISSEPSSENVSPEPRKLLRQKSWSADCLVSLTQLSSEEPSLAEQGFALFRKLFVKQIEKKDTSATLHLSLNDREDCFTVTDNETIFVYSALTGEQERIAVCQQPITKTQFINNEILEVQFAPKKEIAYIDISDDDLRMLDDHPEEEPNDLWASVTFASPQNDRSTNDFDIVTKQKDLHQKEKLDHLIRGTRIIKGKKRWVTVEEKHIAIYDIDGYIHSEGYTSPSSDSPPPYSPPHSPTNDSEEEKGKEKDN